MGIMILDQRTPLATCDASKIWCCSTRCKAAYEHENEDIAFQQQRGNLAACDSVRGGTFAGCCPCPAEVPVFRARSRPHGATLDESPRRHSYSRRARRTRHL